MCYYLYMAKLISDGLFRCPKCRTNKGKDSFPPNRGNPYGIHTLCRECKLKYDKHLRVKDRVKIGERWKRYRIQHAQKFSAREKTQYLVKKGRIEKKNCEVCGSSKSEIHHKDYSNFMDIEWLCRKHHLEADKIRRQNELVHMVVV